MTPVSDKLISARIPHLSADIENKINQIEQYNALYRINKYD